MSVVVLQHVPGEGPYAIAAALESAGLRMRLCRLWEGDPVPDGLTGVEAVVVMGGPMSARDDAGFPTREAELALLRAALAADVPVLGVCLGAQLLAVAAGGAARTGAGTQIGWGGIGLSPSAGTDPLFAGLPERLTVLHWHGDTMDLTDRAVLLASCDRYPVQAFRVNGSAWGLQFHLEVDATAVEAFARAFPEDAAHAPGLLPDTPGSLAALGPHRDRVLGRFAALVAARSGRTATRAFFTPRAGAWEDRFAHQAPAYAAAVARMGLKPGQTALDLGCGTGRALPALRAEVLRDGTVLGVDVTQAMLGAAARTGRSGLAYLLLADCGRLPLASRSVHGIFAAGLLDHLPDPSAALREWARVATADGTLAVFHPSGRVERAARHGRTPSADDPLARPSLEPALHAAGWDLVEYDDAEGHFLALAALTR
ncbi:methyltransferase domain-containing protein [Streptomyces sp. NPDC056796]|uniref:glutamine amidotransferase-related protein n=1 Tax=Streptomyces sp. NPDC056796 TaxID=3345947 RepID=UPI0036AB0833